MSTPREVILDLVPLYLSGEASPETRAFVEARLAEDPELAARVRAMAAEEAAIGVPGAPALVPPPELELAALRRVRTRLRWQRWLFALGVTCVALLFSFRITTNPGEPTQFNFLFEEEPVSMGSIALVGAIAWWVYFRLGRARRQSR